MRIEDIIKSLERYIYKVNPDVFLVVQKEIEPCKMKLFKTIRYTLWLIDKYRNKHRLITVQAVRRVDSPESEEMAIREVEMEFMTVLFEYVRGEKFNLVLGGSYGDEQIPNPTD